MKLKSILISTFLLLSSSLALGDFSKNLFCNEKDFNYFKKSYQASPTGVYIRIGYGRCLVVNGQVGAGMLMLQELSKQRAVPAAYFIAMHIKTGGKLTPTIDKNQLDEAIDEFKYVRTLISLDEEYPYNGWYYYEEESQMDLNSLYYIPLLYMIRFQVGNKNLENDYINHSTGSAYNETVGSLEAMIEHAHYCANTSDENYFDPEKYGFTITACQVLKNIAELIKPLEEQRLEVLDKKICSREGLLDCEAYKTIREEIVNISKKGKAKIREALIKYNQI